MRLILSLLASLSLAQPLMATSCSAIVPLNRTGTLTVQALDIKGGQIPDVEVALYQNGREVEVPLDKVPYGLYEMRLSVRGFPLFTGNILIDEPYTFTRVVVRIGDACPSERQPVAGRVAGKLPQDLWIKAVPLRGNGMAVESKVESKGGFSLSGIEPGEYIFVLISGSSVVHQSVHFVRFPNPSVQITLPEPK